MSYGSFVTLLRVLPDTVRPRDLEGASLPSGNVDRFGRTIDYLRISITDRCNLRCVYCMPEEGVPLGPKDELLTFEEIWRIAAAARGLGFEKFRVTGGEPLVRKDAIELLRGLKARIGDATLALTSNGTLLHDRVDEVRAAGVDRLNISLDTLDPDRFFTLARRPGLELVLAAMERALLAGFERVKLNAVIVPGVNEDDLLPLAELARTRRLDVRFIEQMPLDGHPDGGFLGAEEMARRLGAAFGLSARDPDDARDAAQLVYTAPGWHGRVALIAPRSRKFCQGCNRLRLTPSGELKGCLLSEGTLDLRTPLREGLSDGELSMLLRYAIGIKPREYDDSRYGLDRAMSAIGG